MEKGINCRDCIFAKVLDAHVKQTSYKCTHPKVRDVMKRTVREISDRETDYIFMNYHNVTKAPNCEFYNEKLLIKS